MFDIPILILNPSFSFRIAFTLQVTISHYLLPVVSGVRNP